MSQAAPKLETHPAAMNDAVLQRLAEIRNKSSVKVVDKTTPETKSNEPTNNPFYKIQFDPNLDPQAKVEAIKKLAIFVGSQEASQSLVNAIHEYQEYLQNARETMSTELIRMQDTDTFALLQSVMKNINDELINFEEKMKPLTDITDAAFKLRTNNATLDVIREIKDDKAKEEADRIAAEQQKVEFDKLMERIHNLEHDNHVQEETKGFFGFGGVTKEARIKMAENATELERCNKDLIALQNKVDKFSRPENQTPGEYANEKAKLRELLDLTGEEHKKRQEDLVKSALDFIRFAKKDIGEVRTHMEAMDKQTGKLLDNSLKMSGVYAILNEGIEGAQEENQKINSEVSIIPEGERAVARMQREAKKVLLDGHIQLLQSVIQDSVASAADISTQTIRVKGMKDANTAILNDTRILHTQGVAGIADRLATVLQAVGRTALSESSANAKDTLRNMRRLTDEISQRESISVAMGVNDVNTDLIAALDNLAVYGQVQRAATEITREGLSSIRENLDKIREATQQTQDDLHKSFSAVTDSLNEKGAKQ